MTHGYLDTLGYLKKGSIADSGYFAILWYCTYCSMCNTHTWAVLRILHTVLRIPERGEGGASGGGSPSVRLAGGGAVVGEAGILEVLKSAGTVGERRRRFDVDSAADRIKVKPSSALLSGGGCSSVAGAVAVSGG